jgi:20S proteasome alpha/beta subunit
MISAVDQRAKTFTIAGKEKSRVFKITDKTVMTKAGKPATMRDVVANEEARGSYWKVTDGTLEAKTVKLGPKTDAEKAADEKAKARKKEKESASEANAMPSASPSPSPKP